MHTLPDLFANITRLHAPRPAIVHNQRTLTYASLNSCVYTLAQGLQRRGVRVGDRVGILFRNSPEFVIAYWAALNAGALAVPLNEHYQQNELVYLVDECALKMILTDESFRALCDAVLPQAQTPCDLLLYSIGDELAPPADWQPPDIDPAAPVMFQFSSGTTGRPKRISRTHTQILWELDSLVNTLGIRVDDRLLGVAPFAHVNGLMRTMLAGFRAGAAVYPATYERQRVAALIEQERLTVFIAVPFMFITLAQSRFERAPDFSSLRLCVSASAPLPIRYSREFHSRFGIYTRQLYGSTETGTMSVNLSADIENTLDSVGAPLPGIEFAVVDSESRQVPSGTVGQVIVSSPGAIRGYDEQAETNAFVFRDGYFFTGDLGVLDTQGRLYLQGRLKFLINKGGFKVDPREVEQVLEAHPSVEQVVVVGAPTAFGDDRVKAVVVTRLPCTPNELAEFCHGKIADFKIPSVFEFREQLPTTPTGKVRRTLLTK